MFRGILFQGLRSVLKPWLTVLITAALFGSMHFVNLFSGASTQGTFEQVLFAFGFGCMAGALRLRVGSIVPLMLFHAVWDLLVTESQMAQAPVGQGASTAAATAETGFVISPELFLVAAPSLLYAVVIFWRYLVAVRNRTITEPEFAGSLSQSTMHPGTDPDALVANDR